MTVTADEIARTVTAYETVHGKPTGRADVLHTALATAQPITQRSDLPLHVTCSAIPVAGDGQALQIRHRVLNLWLFPGGHVESHDSSLLAAARRELIEETGLDPAAVQAGSAVPVTPVAIDVHPIPENLDKGEPDHFHADFCYLVHVNSDAVKLRLEEVTDWRWVDLCDVNRDRYTGIRT